MRPYCSRRWMIRRKRLEARIRRSHKSARSLISRRGGFIENHADVMQAGDEGGPVDLRLLAPWLKRMMSVQCCRGRGEGKPFGVVGERDETCFAVAIVAHQDG